MTAKVISNVFEHGTAYGKKGDTVTVPHHIAAAYSKGKKPKLKIIGPVEAAVAKPKVVKAASVKPVAGSNLL